MLVRGAGKERNKTVSLSHRNIRQLWFHFFQCHSLPSIGDLLSFGAKTEAIRREFLAPDKIFFICDSRPKAFSLALASMQDADFKIRGEIFSLILAPLSAMYKFENSLD